MLQMFRIPTVHDHRMLQKVIGDSDRILTFFSLVCAFSLDYYLPFMPHILRICPLSWKSLYYDPPCLTYFITSYFSPSITFFLRSAYVLTPISSTILFLLNPHLCKIVLVSIWVPHIHVLVYGKMTGWRSLPTIKVTVPPLVT